MQSMMHGDGVLFPGARDFIRAAAAAVPIAIASGAMRHEIEEIVRAAGLADLFTAIVAAGDTPESKPSPAPYLLAFEKLRAARGLLERTLVTSFHPQVLREARRLESGIATGLAYPNDRHGLSERRPFGAFVGPGLRVLRAALPARIGRMLAAAGADAAMLHHALVTPKVVARCRDAGAAVFAWTIETRDDLSRVLAAGADGAIANDPSLFDE